MRKTLSGFTIVELILVISIIGILSTIGVVSYNSIKSSSEALQKETKAKTITEAIEKYYEKNGTYPSCADLTQSSKIVTEDVLLGLDPGVLTVPGEPEGTNSITCTTTPALSQYGYTSDGGSFSLLYLKDESTTESTAILSKHGYEKIEFNYTGSYQSYTVPPDVYYIQVEAWGAQGGGDTGGKGGFATANIPVTPGEILRIYIGGRGVTGTCTFIDGCMLGGFNGGGDGGGSDVTSTGHGGGGATDIRKSPYDLASRIIVAGGGGARGGEKYSGVGAGGDGGGEVGQNGYACTNCSGSPTGGPGSGATQTSGGAGGSAGSYSTEYPGGVGGNGSLGQGGKGRSCWWSGSGGGGGGYYGGGGGGCPGQHGGGGGSSWVTPDANNIKYSTGLKTGNGLAIIYISL